MINANILGICECISKDSKEYKILISINVFDEEFSKRLESIEKLLDSLCREDNLNKQKTNRAITRIDSYENGAEYLLPYDFDLLIEILTLLTYMKGTNAFVCDEIITKEQLSVNNRKEFYFFLAEIFKNSILTLKEAEKKENPITFKKRGDR